MASWSIIPSEPAPNKELKTEPITQIYYQALKDTDIRDLDVLTKKSDGNRFLCWITGCATAVNSRINEETQGNNEKTPCEALN
jgi:hypothetical protein